MTALRTSSSAAAQRRILVLAVGVLVALLSSTVSRQARRGDLPAATVVTPGVVGLPQQDLSPVAHPVTLRSTLSSPATPLLSWGLLLALALLRARAAGARVTGSAPQRGGRLGAGTRSGRGPPRQRWPKNLPRRAPVRA